MATRVHAAAADMCRAAPPTAGPADFTHKIVRDLHWVLTSPHLLAPNAIVPTLPDEQAARIAARSHTWLAALDADPSPLLEFLQSQRNVRRHDGVRREQMRRRQDPVEVADDFVGEVGRVGGRWRGAAHCLLYTSPSPRD